MTFDILSNILALGSYLIFGVSCILLYIRYMHMFQLNSYHAAPQIKWIEKNFIEVFFQVVLISLFVFFLINFNVNINLFPLISLIFAIIPLVKKAKKKLVFTPRVIRMCLTSVVFCAILIKFFYYNLNIAILLIYTLTPFMAIIANFINKPIERLINVRYINDAKQIINSLPDLIIFGITGSYGKTSVKYYLKALLSVKYNVLMTPESYNTTMGVVKTVRNSLTAAHEVFICEMGAKNVGEIKEICDVVKPRHSMITSIGPQHLETFKNIDNIIKTKFEIADCIDGNISSGTVFLNYDDEYIRNHKIDKNIITYSINNNKTTDYRAENIIVSERGTKFTVVAPGDERADFETRLIGKHNVQNIVGAIAAANFLGIKLIELVLPVKRLESVPHRLQLINRGDRIIIDDAFNSNPSGAKAALEVLSLLKKSDEKNTAILVTPGMIELGDEEYALNREFGEQAAASCDYAVLIGEKRAVPIREGLLNANLNFNLKFKEENIKVFSTLQAGLEFIDRISCDGKKIILFENDLPDNY